MAKQKINKSKNTALESHKKSDKAKWAITFISLILIATLLGGLSFYVVNNNKTNNPPPIEQGQGQTEEIKNVSFNVKDYSVTKEEFMNAGGLPGFRLDASKIEESIDYNIPINIIFIDKLTHQSIISIESLTISLHKVNDSSLGKEFYLMFLNLDSLLKSNKINVLYRSGDMQQMISFGNYYTYSGFCNCKGMNSEGNYFVFTLCINSGTIQDLESINLYFEIDFKE